MTKYLIWDFDGTLASREGMWSGTLLEVLDCEMPSHQFTIDQVWPHLRAGFPWHIPEVPHPHLATADEWSKQLAPVFVNTYQALGIDRPAARELANRVRGQYYQPHRWRVYHDSARWSVRLSTCATRPGARTCGRSQGSSTSQC
jgi:putative hydrolase of the HAD superfamily